MGCWPLRAPLLPPSRRRGTRAPSRRYERQPVPCDLRSPLGVQAARVRTRPAEADRRRARVPTVFCGAIDPELPASRRDSLSLPRERAS